MDKVVTQPLLTKFSCLGDKCGDTCCFGWSMQLDDATFFKYQKEAPELLDAVMIDEDGTRVMKRDAQSGYCVKLEGGFCGVHRDRGTAMLGDACHFYPRITRRLGERTVMTATMSCPEVARLALARENHDPAWPVEDVERLPGIIKDMLPEGMTSDHAWAVHQAYVAALADESINPERAVLRLLMLSKSLAMMPKERWTEACLHYLPLMDGRIPTAEAKAEDPFNLVQSVCGLMIATRKVRGARLQHVLDTMCGVLGIQMDWATSNMQLLGNAAERAVELGLRMQEQSAILSPLLRNYVITQAETHLLPFAGLGENPVERMTLVAWRLAVMKLAFACMQARSKIFDMEQVVAVIQPLSRVLEHLGSADFLFSIMQEVGWDREARLRSLLGS